jgi:uncharacterized protein (DUF302 family)
MAEEPATTTYVIAGAFDQAVKSVRHALAEARLRIVGELNMSGRMQRELRMKTAPCLVLFASPAAPEAADLFADRRAGAVTPLHIVISARGPQTEVHILRFVPRENGLLNAPAAAVLGRTQTAISQAIERLGMRADVSA